MNRLGQTPRAHGWEFRVEEPDPGQPRPSAVRPCSKRRGWVEAPRWVLLGALVFAPCAYGSTRPWAVLLLSLVLALANVGWLTECLLRRRRPCLSGVAVVAVVWLLAQGWWMTCNAQAAYHRGLGVLLPAEPWLGSAPGSVDRAFSFFTMLFLTNLLVAFLFICDLVRRPVWRNRLWLTMALTGAGTALAGIVLKLGGPSVMAWVWEQEKIDLANNFAGFRYRGNAGAFLNLVLPLLAGLSWLKMRRHGRPWAKTCWASALLLFLAGIQFNPSRASWCIGLTLGILFLILVCWQGVRRSSAQTQGRVLAGYFLVATLVAVALTSVVMFGGWENSWSRLNRLGLDLSRRSPVAVYRTMVPEAGWLGFGPGTFEAIFPAFQLTHPYADSRTAALWKEGYWQHAHQDYYQTVIEWGYLGAAAWMILLGGGLLCGLRKLRRGRFDSSLGWLVAGCLLAIGGVLAHAWVDFPLQIASIQLYLAVLLGICWSRTGAIAGQKSVHQPPRRMQPHLRAGIHLATALPLLGKRRAKSGDNGC